ncbi:MAG: hypothetical protein GWM98_04590 [Nitrospinaceae bacterium]|nr:hypothetical protein [Deltaproteobacteria bacterium]NIY14197.1 hypothetical protein [Nitrospinaceae bacterium]
MTRTAQTEYKEKAQKVRDLMDQIQKALETHEEETKSDPRNWGRAGDLGHVAAELRNVLGFLRNEEEPEIPDLVGYLNS